LVKDNVRVIVNPGYFGFIQWLRLAAINSIELTNEIRTCCALTHVATHLEQGSSDERLPIENENFLRSKLEEILL
jgi:hypothetical protein